jgi:hypothetical protein
MVNKSSYESSQFPVYSIHPLFFIEQEHSLLCSLHQPPDPILHKIKSIHALAHNIFIIHFNIILLYILLRNFLFFEVSTAECFTNFSFLVYVLHCPPIPLNSKTVGGRIMNLTAYKDKRCRNDSFVAC